VAFTEYMNFTNSNLEKIRQIQMRLHKEFGPIVRKQGLLGAAEQCHSYRSSQTLEMHQNCG